MSHKIPKQMIEHIQKENDIIDIIGGYVQLNKRGRNHWGLCPFHDEKSPSFSVSEDKQLFHCFGCGKGGNVITFVMEMETFSYIDAIKYLADRTGIALPDNHSTNNVISEETEQMLQAYDWLTKYYVHYLKYSSDATEAKQYFEQRGVNIETIDRFQLGYAPLDSNITIKFLKNKGFHEQFLLKCGLLLSRDDGTYVDPYRGRVIFPIKNHLNKTVAFGARAIIDEKPKYLNSPEHELFRKGNILFNFNLAKNIIRKENNVIIFEGYMDVLAADQAGLKNVIATLGTALSINQAKTIRRYVDSVILCFDTDEAGKKGAFDAAKILTDVGCSVKIANMPNNYDPDEYIQEFGGIQFKERIIDVSDTYFKFLMNYKRQKFNLSIESEKIAYIEEITKQLSLIESDIEREYYVKEIAEEFNLSEHIIQKSVLHYKKTNKRQHNLDKTQKFSNTNHNITPLHHNRLQRAYYTAERKLIAYMLNNSYLIEKVKIQLGTYFNVEQHRAIVEILYELYDEQKAVTVSDLINRLQDEKLVQIVSEIAFMPLNDEQSEEEIDDYIKIIKAESNQLSKLRRLKEEQKRLEKENNPILAAQIGIEIINIERELKNLH